MDEDLPETLPELIAGEPPPDSSPASVAADEEEAIFEPVPLRDLSTADETATATSSVFSGNPTPSDYSNFSSDLEMRGDFSVEPPSPSPASVDSPSSKPRHNPALPDVPQELVHLVDSAVLGRLESVEQLKSIVSSDEHDPGDISRSAVDALLAKMGGVDDLEGSQSNIGENPPSIMLNSRAAVVAGELIPYLSCEPRTRMVRGLYSILRACTRNRAMCSSSGLLEVLLEASEKIFLRTDDLWDGFHLCQCIRILGGHSLSVADLNRWLEVIKKCVGIATDRGLHLMLALEKAVGGKEARGPAYTFEFDGESSGLLGPGESRWPFSNGYAFATWIYIESFSDTLNTATAAAAIAAAAAARSGKSSAVSAAAAASALAGEGTAHMPRLFSFLSSDNNGVEAYFHGHFLVVEIGSGKGKKASLHFTYAFKPQCWYFIGLEHVCKQGLIGKTESELKLYVDGSLHESRPFDIPWISKPLAFCCIGTNPPPTMAGLQRRRRQCPLFAEMGPIYIFKEPIGQERMARLALRGGDVLPSFGSGAGLPWFSPNDQIRNLAEESASLDMDIAGSLHLLYHPVLLNGRLCPDASPSGVSGFHRRPAEVLGQVHVAARICPTVSLWALASGGPLALLPLVVSNVELDLEASFGDCAVAFATIKIAAPIFRIISMAIQHPGNNEELCRTKAPELLSRILHFLLQTLSTLELQGKDGVGEEELVAATVSLCQSQKNNHALKVQLFRTLLLDLKMWSLCSYGLQKKLLSSLADMVFSESSAIRDANALQMLLDGCRKCYWVIHEPDSVDTFSLHGAPRPLGEVNALVDELLVVVELLVGAAVPSSVSDEIRCLIGFLVDCPQPNQVARVLHLIYRLIVQPNTARAHAFAQSFISCGGVDTLLVLLQREAKLGNLNILENADEKSSVSLLSEKTMLDRQVGCENIKANHAKSANIDECVSDGEGLRSKSPKSDGTADVSEVERQTSVSEIQVLTNLGGINFSISADSARNNVYHVDNNDGIVVGIIKLLGALINSGQLKRDCSIPSSNVQGGFSNNGLPDDGSTMFDDKVALLLFALQKAFQAAPQRLMTINVHTALLSASINYSSNDDTLNLFDSGHHFEHVHILLVLLRSLPYASRTLQVRAIQDLLFLACSHPDNRSRLTCMEEWPEWILEVLISNYELDASKNHASVSISEIEDLIFNFLIIMLEHSMRQKDGWKDIEATIHCAEWLSMVGGSSTGDQRMRREESLPVFKRRLLGGLLDFAARELRVQTEVIAAAAAGVAAEGLSPQEAKAEAENAAQLSVALAENAIVILMLVEDHLRLQAQLFCLSHQVDIPGSPSTLKSRSSSSGEPGKKMDTSGEPGKKMDTLGLTNPSSGDTGGLSLDVLASMADAKGQISAATMERLSAAAAAEPYDSVRCAFVSYGSCAVDLAEGWKSRSRMWYGVGLPSTMNTFGGGGSGWEAWMSTLERDSDGIWIEHSLVKKSVAMLQALLLDESGIGGGLGIGGGSGTGMGGMTALYQLLDSDQPFLSMLRMVLVSMREEDNGEEDIFMRTLSIKDDISESLLAQYRNNIPLDNNNRSSRKPRSALLWSVLAPILNMPVSESKRQRVLVACCILYAEIWHAIGKDRKPLRKLYVESILPPFVAILRRWRPLLAGIHEFTSSDGLNPLIADDRALAADTLPIEAALLMISPGWAAAFASPPAAMALAMIAAGAGGGEYPNPAKNSPLRRDSLLLERKAARLQTFSSFQKPLETSSRSPSLHKDKAAAKAAALAAARDLERNAKIGSGRGLSAVAMATSAQRRSAGDLERAKRWNISEAMGTAWTESLQSADTKSISGRDLSALSYKYVAVLVASLALARNIERMEVERRTQVDFLDSHIATTGRRAWRKLIHCLIEMNALFGLFGEHYCNPERIFWKLDLMENSSRMRRYLKRNYNGSDHLGAAADYEDRQVTSKSKAETSLTSSALAEAISLEEGNEDDEMMEPKNFDKNVENQQRDPVVEQRQEAHDAVGTGDLIDQDMVQMAPVTAPGYVPSDLDERLVLEVPSVMVRPLKVIRGIFQVTTKKINFVIDQRKHDIYSKEMLSTCRQSGEQEKDRSWSIASLHQVYSRRYLLRRSALELFMVDRSNFFFDFGSTESRKSAYRAIVQVRPPYLNNIYLATQRPDQLLKRTELMERWARWEISNFEYLMALNTLAGRSYNDITQYPVFPWILADYSSKTLDLQDPASYRDLSKPIGALNPERLKKFQERYSSFDDPLIPKFHYGSHYSSAGTVLYYLLRVEPFTTLSIQLQGGKFDHADRMFFDIGATWDGVLEDMSDVKELVPEMYYLPEVLVNINSIDFGTTQLGGKLDSVKLPPWADNPVDFIHKHRTALESEHVSAHLHEWIDLIFGYKQRGKEAISSNNVFFYITYEGTVDIDKIADPVQRRATQDQIAYFGQTPSQLLTVPHIKRKPLADVLHLQTIFRSPAEIKPYVIPNPERCNVPAGAIFASQDSVIVLDEHAPAATIALHKWQPNTPDGQGAPFQFQHGKSSSSSTSGAFMRMFKAPSGSGADEWQFPRAVALCASGMQSSAIVAITYDKEIITGGHADNSVKLISCDGAKTLETARAHCAPVTCLSVASDSNYLVTGSRDTTLILWKLNRSSSLNVYSMTDHSVSSSSGPTSPLAGHASSNKTAGNSKRRRIEGPIHVLRGHRGAVVCCSVSSDLGVVASSSDASGLLIHSLTRGRLMRKLDSIRADVVSLSSLGIVIIWDKFEKKIRTLTVNGIPIATACLSPFAGEISCIEISADGESALIGTSSRVDNSRDSMNVMEQRTNSLDSPSHQRTDNLLSVPVPALCFLNIHSLEVFHTVTLENGQDVTAIALTKDDTNLLVSTADKQLIVFKDPTLTLKVVDQMLRLGWEGDGLLRP